MVSSLGLRARLVWLMVVALLPVLGLVAWAAASKQSDALKLARSTLQSQALLTAASQQPQVEAVKQLLGDLASAPSVKGRLPGLCSEYLRNLQAMHPQYTDLGVVALDGTVLCHSEAAMVGADAGARPFFKRVMASRQFSIGEYGTGRRSGQAGVGFSAPVHDNAGVLSGVVFAALGVRAFAPLLAQVAPPAGASVVLTDRQGTILAARPAAAGAVGSPQADATIRVFLQAPRVGVEGAPDAGGCGPSPRRGAGPRFISPWVTRLPGDWTPPEQPNPARGPGVLKETADRCVTK